MTIKFEILKKTLLYRLLAFGLGMGITTLFLFNKPILSLQITIISELSSIVLYYLYEYFWRKQIQRIKIKHGSHILLMKDTDRHAWYNVIEILDENKFIIEVV